MNDPSPIIFYHYFDLSDPQHFCDTLSARFRASGHTRPIEFRKLNCYHELPGEDGDLFSYDGIVMSALADKGLIRRLPDIISTDGIFDWMLDTSKVKKKVYGLPFMTCCTALICREEDALDITNVFDVRLKGQLKVPLRSMVYFYYLQSFCNYQDKGVRSYHAMKLLKWLMGSDKAFELSGFANYNGIESFRDGKCKYFLGFTENMRFFPKRNYKVTLANFSEEESLQVPLMLTDFVSVSPRTSGEKLLDCLDLVEIITSREFLHDIHLEKGKLQYMLPVHRDLYPRLSALDPVYNQFYDIVSREDNCVFRYTPNFYEIFPAYEGLIIEMLRSDPTPVDPKEETPLILDLLNPRL